MRSGISASALVFHFLIQTTGALEYHAGGIVRANRHVKELALVFTGHEFAEGGDRIATSLRSHGVRAAFFFTGDFYRTTEFRPFVRRLKEEGHYLGAHSDKHLLYASWTCRDSLLVSKKTFLDDLNVNYAELEKFGIRKNNAPYFLPPFEWYNDTISAWVAENGLRLVNFTPGTLSHTDWTEPSLAKQYRSSDTILRQILEFEQTAPDALSGFILLMHTGAGPRRIDKFHDHLDTLLTILKERGYAVERLDKMLNKYLPSTHTR